MTVNVSTKLLEVGDHKAICEHDGEQYEINGVDAVVLALGVKSDRSFAESLNGCGSTIAEIGDAAGVKNGYLNIREGYETGLVL